MSSTSWQQVRLSSDLFRKALDRYIDVNKPDPISRKQLEGWSLQWYDESVEVDHDVANTNDKNDDLITTIEDPSHKIQGRLEIGGEFLLITLQINCTWKTTTTGSNEKEASTTQYGHFVFAGHAMARFWTKTELMNKTSNHQQGKDDDPNGTRNKKDQKVQDKIRTKMMARLLDDAYISKLLVSTTTRDNNDPRRQGGSLLAQAHIHFTPNSLEERVTVMDDVGEAIKRAIWSATESPLDVVELLLALPLLPTTDHNSTGDNSIPITTTSLANRARLRLLEDAMCEACEKEGEEELLDDLTISDDEKKVKDSRDFTTKEVGQPKTKKNKSTTRKKT